MTETEFLILKFTHVMHRPVMFPEIAEALGKDKYIACYHATSAMREKGWITEIADPTKHLQYVYAPTEKGWQEYEANRETYNAAQFAIPIQGGF